MGKARMLAAAIALVLSGCTSFEDVDVLRYAHETGLVVSTGPAPVGAQPLSVVAVQQNGFYLLGVVPFVPVRLEDGVELLAEHAASVGADGIADLKIDYRPASLLRFFTFPLPDWSASMNLTGIAYRLPSPQPRP